MARAATSSAFSWKPTGVSSTTAGTGGGPRRSSRPRCTLLIVGLVSPEPMMARRRGSSPGIAPTLEGLMQHVGQLVGELEMDVMVGGREPTHRDALVGGRGAVDVAPLVLAPVVTAVSWDQ